MVEGVPNDSRPDSPDEARRILEEIKQQEVETWEDTPEDAREELEGLREVTAETLDNPNHVLPELLQNADDIGGDCSRVTIRLEEGRLVFRNHEEPMAVENVAALGGFTQSTKRGDLDSIGHFGIGFKTVFSLTSRPYVHSGYFSFRYSRDEQTIPKLVEYAEQPSTDADFFGGTTITLPFTEEAEDNRRDILEDQLRNIESLLPFLNHITTIEVSLLGEQYTYRRESSGDSDEFEILREHDGEVIQADRIRLFSESFEPGRDLLKTIAQKRNLKSDALRELDPNLDVTLAIPLDETGAPTPRDESHLFCYFPTAPNTQLPFDIQADFSLKPDRRSIIWPDEFNQELLGLVSTVYETAFTQFQREQEDASTVLELVPDPALDRDQTPFLEPVVEEITEFVRSTACVPDRQGTLRQPTEVVFLDQPFRELLTEQEVGEVLDRGGRYPTERVSSAAEDRLKTVVPESHVDTESLLDGRIDPALVESREVEWVVRFLAGIRRYWNAEYDSSGRLPFNSDARAAKREFRATVEETPLVPLESGAMASYEDLDGNVYRLGPGYADDYKLFADGESLNLLDSELLAELDSPSEDLAREASLAKDVLFEDDLLGIAELEPADVVRDVINPAFESGSIDAETADQFVLFVSRRAGTLADQANIKLRPAGTSATDDAFRAPESLYLGSAYVDAYDTDVIFEPFDDLAPVSDHYLDLDDRSRGEWTEALARLGLRQRIEVNQQDPWESDRFRSKAAIESFLADHGDGGKTDVHDEQYVDGYNGQTRKWQWMKREERRGSVKNYKYALVDRFLSDDVRATLESLTGGESQSADITFWTEFLKMLDEWWSDYYEDRVYRNYQYCRRDNKYRIRAGDCYCPSTFGRFLRAATWAPGSEGTLHQPRALFAHNELTEDKPVTFIDPEPDSRGLVEFLELQHSPGVFVTIATLGELIDKKRAEVEDDSDDPDELERTIRKQLYAVEEDLLGSDSGAETPDPEAVRRLRELPFVYVRDADPAFRTPAQVTWSGPALGNHRVPIAEIYGDFETLFKKLGVRSEPTLEDCIVFLGTGELTADAESNTDGPRWSEFETAWRRVLQESVYLRRAKLDGAEDSLEEATETLRTKGRVATAGETLVDWADVRFHSTDETLLSNLPPAIENQVLYPWRDRRYVDPVYTERLEQFTGTDPLETALDRELATDVERDDLVGTLASEYPQILAVAYTYLQDTEAEPQTETIEELAGLGLYRVEVIECQYYLDDEYETTTTDQRCFVDPEPEHPRIILSTDSRAEFALVDAIARELELEPGARSELVTLMKGALGKREPMLEAFLEDNDYEYQQLPTEIATQDRTVGTPPNSSEAPQQSEPEPQADDASSSDADGEATASTDTGGTPSATTASTSTAEPSSASGGTRSGAASGSTSADGTQSTAEAAGTGPTPPVPDVDLPEDTRQSSSTEASVPESGGPSTEPDSDRGPSQGGGSSSRRASHRTSGGGGWGSGGVEQQETGDAGEAFVFDELIDVVEGYFRDVGELLDPAVDEPGREATIEGTVEGSERTVRIADVSTDNLGYDIHVDGVTLSPTPDSLRIAELADDARTFVEVKSSKDRTRTFTLTPNEYRKAIRSPTEMVVVRVHDALSDEPTVDRLFHTVPELSERVDDTEHRPAGLEIHYGE